MQSAQSGPLVIYGSRNAPGEGGSNNPDIAPSLIIGGVSFFDPRSGYNVRRTGALGLGVAHQRVLSGTPAAAATANIAALANVVNGAPMALVGASGAGVTLMAAAATVWASGNVIPIGSLALDGLPGLITYGLANPQGNFKTAVYDNSKALARAVSITGVAGGAGGHFLVSGWDLYGYPQTENINAAAGAVTTNGKKAFKFIKPGGVVPLFTDAHNYSVGTADIFGFPMRAAVFPETLIWWNNGLIVANAGFVAADTTNPATSTTGDVRGTYAVQSASDGVKQLYVSCSPGALGIVTPAGLFGVTPA